MPRSPDRPEACQLTVAAAAVAYTGTAGRTSALAPGNYWLSVTTDAFVLQGGSSVTAVGISGGACSPIVFAGERVPVHVTVTATDGYFSGLQVASGGNLVVTPRV